MANSINTRKLSYNSAKLLRDSVQDAATNTSPVLYVTIGNNVPYANEASPDSIVDTINTEKEAWDNIFAAKRATGNDIQLVIPRVDWTANTKYRQYDDTSNIIDLITANTQLNLKPMYVITSARNVYKCLSNSAGANSTVEPTGDYTTSNGNISTTDGFIWKYMFNVQPSNKFLDDSFIPAPTSTLALDFGVSDAGVLIGELTTIVVTANGTNYREASNIRVDGFDSGQSTIRLSNTANTLAIFSIPTLANLANMSISGTGFAVDTHITGVAIANGLITLSSATNTSGGNANNITISTRVYIEGDGIGAVANAVLSDTSINVTDANANVARINVTTIGTGYTRANAFIYGSGTGANTRVIIGPKFGHAFNAAEELYSNSVLIVVRFGELDSTENGLISVDTSFRQTGLLQNPYKYDANSRVEASNANTVISQTTDLSVVAGTNYTLNEYVFQGSSANNSSAYGYLHAQTSNEARLTRVIGTFETGLPLIGATSGVSRTVTGVADPELKPYSGDFLYIENAVKTDRADGQAENIKLTISF
jgi:hypothetical protein